MNLDIRPWLEQAARAGEVAEIRGAALELEIGALTDLNAKRRGPALLFSDIAGHAGAGRVVTCTLSRPRRLALALGLDLHGPPHAVVGELRARTAAWRDRAPEMTPIAGEPPQSWRALEGDEIDVTRYPAPLWHEGDGGRYLGTGCGVFTRAPDEDWVNVGTYRVAVHGPRALGLMAHPSQHGGMHLRRWHDRGEAAPVAVSFGHHPLLQLAAGMSVPYGLGELNYIGAMAGEPIEVVHGERTGLPIPAGSELAVEGFVAPGDLLDEGPFGEFTGYFAGGRSPRAVIRVEQVYERGDPIVYGSLPAKPPFDHSYWRSALQSAMLLDGLRTAGVPGVEAVWQHEAGCGWFWTVLAIRQRYPGHARQAGHAAHSVSAGATMGRYVVVVDDDVDVTDLEQVLWALSTRSDPATSIDVVPGLPTTPLDPMIAPGAATAGARAVIDACRPLDDARFPATVEVSDVLRARVSARWGQLLGWTATTEGDT